ncbi:hypothetical protein GCM10007094_14930 [Pseudovibrio japonicus]|uniref:Tail specific protease domain-containing protein n=1 Tax=Pseudovibrio japonicus TaxID=366534 RepID=A0ABQ3E6C6_9HYPH|nr:S41 family peptidase [Pseudovibrio japonicus]GHB27611.1 hypothetical protein GCM10007094_14930 [Pseudovibrio japonicus]
MDQETATRPHMSELRNVLTSVEDPSAPIPSALKHYAAGRIYSAVETCFAHWENVPDLCNADLYFDYLNALEGTQDRLGFLLATQSYLARLQNAHTQFIDRTLLKNSSFGFWARPLPASASTPNDLVWTVCKSTLSDLKTGDIIKEVNNRPAKEFFDHYTQFVSASKPEAVSYSLMFRGFLFPERLNLTLSDGRKLHISRTAAKPPLTRQKRVELDRSGKHPRLIIRSFAEPEFEQQALAFLNQIDNEAPLILDLRGNGGGDTPSSLRKKFCKEPTPLSMERTPQFMGLEKAEQALPAFQNGELSALHLPPNVQRTPMTLLTKGEIQPASLTPFKGKLVVLIDIGSCSATEDLLIPLKQSGRAVFVGEASAGSTGQPYFEAPLPGTQLMVSTKRTDFPDGSTFEGVGIQPDYPVPLTAEDLQQGNDPALIRAEQLLS